MKVHYAMLSQGAQVRCRLPEDHDNHDQALVLRNSHTFQPKATVATYTLDSLKNAARNLRTAFDAGFEVICDESTVGLNEWAVSEIERLRNDNERLMRCCGKDEMRTEIDDYRNIKIDNDRLRAMEHRAKLARDAHADKESEMALHDDAIYILTGQPEGLYT